MSGWSACTATTEAARLPPMNATDLYDTDFVAWTEQQAAALRRLPAGSNSLDIDHLAEEVEDLGKRDVREVESLIRQILLHALKIALDPQAHAARRWREEIVAFQDDAQRAFSPSMRQKINLDRLWTKAVDQLLAGLDPAARQASARLMAQPAGCPTTLTGLMSSGCVVDRLRDEIGETVTALVRTADRAG